jgi:hypothetical protein
VVENISRVWVRREIPAETLANLLGAITKTLADQKNITKFCAEMLRIAGYFVFSKHKFI